MNEKQTFTDPLKKFKIGIPSEWKYSKEGGKVKAEGPHQFVVSDDCIFQISFKKINDHISNMIKANKLKPHDFDLPNVSFKERFDENERVCSYNWISVIDEYFILAIYYYNPEKKQSKEIALDLTDIRMALQNIYFQREKSIAQESGNHDYYRIEAWRDKPVKFLDSLALKDRSQVKTMTLNIDVIKLYSLLKIRISHEPNGFYNWTKVGRPLDNIIWWDFVLECEKGFIHLWRTPHVIEAQYCIDDPDFDVTRFLLENINRNSKEISEMTNSFDKHIIYINHFKSYKDCVEVLWKEISKIALTQPSSPKQHLATHTEVQIYNAEVRQFLDNSVKYHALAKSLVLNAAFQIESFLNLVIRIGSKAELKAYPEILDKFLRLDFKTRVRNMGYYSNILANSVDCKNQIIKNACELMTIRNKYVHFDESSSYNKLGMILYDDDYPLHPITNDRPAIESFKQMFHNPDINTVTKAYENSNEFVAYIKSLFKTEYVTNLNFLLDQNPIGYNESRGQYSSVYNPIALDFFAS